MKVMAPMRAAPRRDCRASKTFPVALFDVQDDQTFAAEANAYGVRPSLSAWIGTSMHEHERTDYLTFAT